MLRLGCMSAGHLVLFRKLIQDIGIKLGRFCVFLLCGNVASSIGFSCSFCLRFSKRPLAGILFIVTGELGKLITGQLARTDCPLGAFTKADVKRQASREIPAGGVCPVC